jgi:hypothetical protein
MHYGAGILAGIASSALFWLMDKYILSLAQSYQIGGMIACFVVFGGAGYWLASRNPKRAGAPAGTRIATNLKGRNIKASVDGVSTTGGGGTDILSDIDAKGDIEADAKNIKTKP